MSKWRHALARGLRRLRVAGTGRVAGMMATRNEDWVLGLSLRAALCYCDLVVIADHASDDDTQRILGQVRAEFPHCTLEVFRVEHAEWDEMDVRQEMLDRARALGASHFVIVDADELPTGNLLPRLRRWALSTRPGEFNSLPMVAPYLGADVRRYDGAWGVQSSIPWCVGDAPSLHYAVRGAHQLHGRAPRGARDGGMLLSAPHSGGLFHLQFIDAQRLAAKAVWYKMIETVRYPGLRSPAELNALYDWTLREPAAARLAPVPESWWAPWVARGWLEHLKPAARPWQLAEAERLLLLHGARTFAGLELHGLLETRAATQRA
jgi:hypothetical protein